MKKLLSILTFLIFSVLSLVWYLHKDDDHYVEIPIGFLRRGIPYAELEIENNVFKVGVDLGTGRPLSLYQKYLNPLIKTPLGTYEFSDIKGNQYATSLYSIKKAHLGKIVMSDIKVIEEVNKGFVLSGSSVPEKNAENVAGYIGRAALTYSNWLFDFSHSIMIATNSHKKLEEHGYSVDEWVCIPFSKERCGLIISIEIDNGIKRFVIDTGSTNTLLKQVSEKELFVSSCNRFVIKNKNFGPIDIYRFPISDLSYGEVDGFLGMDFMRHHPLYFDFINNIVYICPNSGDTQIFGKEG